jgi:hypothetical protein
MYTHIYPRIWGHMKKKCTHKKSKMLFHDVPCSSISLSINYIMAINLSNICPYQPRGPPWLTCPAFTGINFEASKSGG